MYHFTPYNLTLRGSIVNINEPWVMGILNLTPDSFYSDSRCNESTMIEQRVNQIITEGAKIIDIGGYSSRPGANDITPDEEYSRLATGLDIIKRIAPNAIISVDTFRADVARRCVNNWGVDIINDISGGEMDPEMFSAVADMHVPYILMHMQGTPRDMQKAPHYDNLMCEVFRSLGERVELLHEMGVADVILDPGFGFGKTMEQNYEMMARLGEFRLLECPILAGVSRKSMVYRLLGTTPEESLNGTTALNTIALMNGASILRVHDVREAVEAVKIYQQCLISD